ncbi:ferredoxin [Spongiibacter sp. IMCC21906]|uniref:2Fe-2S iron-sulfur cluster-binding protein n=1 Tax=Spongiibacter sp. IMCC21906 TaxID=1620392 RepID=UPI00062DDC2E|nr:2Fe-2S iron-sulfur cluster-binding protein [Spongiibacter sp. IMCC21906]AKH68655.1 ferredoxin [Spongiibacter sp. IMCC21906]
MPKVTYITAIGEARDVDVPVGTSCMEGAVQNLVPGIDGDCGGAAACGTCHVYVDQEWAEKAGRPEDDLEVQMLELTDDVSPTSRLACQIVVTEELDGLILRMPEGQH